MKVRTLVACAVILGAAGTAHATGFAVYFANVGASGAVSVSSGVNSAARTGVGAYTVTFNRDVKNCGYVASIRGAKSGFATVNVKALTVLTVDTFSRVGTAANLPFNLIVTCAP